MYFLIGGGEIGNLETFELDEALVKLCTKENQKFLFIPTASHDSEGYIQAVKTIYRDKLHCEFDHLSLSEGPHQSEIENKIENADIIYVGGGDTKFLIDKWREYKLDKILAYHKEGKILSGLSAGSICWFEKGISDTASFSNSTEKWQYILIDGLGFLPGIHSPHLNEREKESNYQEFTNENNMIFIGIDNNCALLVEKNEYKIYRSDKNRNAYIITTENGIVKKRMIADNGNIKELFSKSELT